MTQLPKYVKRCFYLTQRISVAVCFICCISAIPALAEQDCSKALVVATMYDQTLSVKNLALAYTLSEQSYEEAKARAGVNAVIYGIPVSASYDQYHQAAQSKATELHLSNFEQWAETYVTTGLNAASRDAYIACVQANSSGFAFYTKSISKQYFIVRVEYAAGPDARPLRGKLANTANIKQSDASSLNEIVTNTVFENKVGQDHIVTPVDRKQESALTLRIGSTVLSLVLPPLELPPPLPKVISLTDTYAVRWESSKSFPEWLEHGVPYPLNLHQTYLHLTCLNADEGYVLQRNTVSFSPSSVGSCGRVLCPENDNGVTPQPLASQCQGNATERRICFVTPMSINRGEQTCSFRFEMTGQEVLGQQ